jgi:hypothetical protein
MNKILRTKKTKEAQISDKKDDIVQVTGFSVKPKSPKEGKKVIIKMDIKNVSKKTIKSVPWQIVKNRKIMDSGSRFNLSPGDKFSVSLTWTATRGSHFIYGDVDPENVLKEPRPKQFNNSPQGIDVNVS